MEIDTHYWSGTDATINLIHLFTHLHYTLEEQTDTFLRYSKASKQYIVFYTDTGYYYYRCEAPEEKLRGSDLISTFCTSLTTSDNSSLWERIMRKYEEYLATADDSKASPYSLKKVAEDFNHYTQKMFEVDPSGLETLYKMALTLPLLEPSMTMDEQGFLLFPLYNNENVICGYLQQTPSGIQPYAYTNPNVGIWRTAIPDKVNEFILFSTPKEAIAFYITYRPEHTVCMAIPTINITTYQTISRFQKVLKPKRTFFAFTTNTVIQGFLEDLRFLAQHDNCGFDLEDTKLRFTLKQPDDVAFSKFYKKIQEFNNNVIAYYKKFNKTRSVNRRLVLKHSIIPKRISSGIIMCYVPLEVDALKFMVVVYQKFFLPPDLKVIKSREHSWYRSYMKNDSIKSSTESYTSLKLAI